MVTPLRRRDWSRLALLIALSVVVSVWAQGLLQPHHRSAPPQYSVDALETLARFKLSSEQPWAPWFGERFQRIGAPFGADWSSYPLPDQWLYWIFGQLSRVTGLVPASHLALLFAHILAAVSFYAAARKLGHHPYPAIGCAVLFAFSHFNLHRSLSHFSFTLSFCVPPMVVLAWCLGASRRMKLDRSKVLGVSGVSALLGAANPYFTFLFVQLLVGALLYQLTGNRRCPSNLRAIGIAGVMTFVAFVATYAPTLIDRTTGGDEAVLLTRDYADGEIYALKPIELAIPPPAHRVSWFGSLGSVYRSSTQAPGEFPGAYLGVLSVVALGWLFVSAWRHWRAGRGALRPAGPALVIWIGIVAVVGGLHGALALMGVDEFRASNRYSVVILAVSLLFLSGQLTRLWPQGRPARAIALTGLAAVVVLGIVEQTPRLRSRAEAERLARTVAEDQQFARTLETSLPAGTAVFQLPAVPFPEQPTVGAMTDYALFRPFLHSETLRFSYGSMARTKQARWASMVSRLPPDQFIQALEAAGFGAVYLNRSAFPDRGATLINALVSHQCSPIPWLETSEHAAIRLRPDPRPQVPNLNDPRLLDPWSKENLPPSEGPLLYAGPGWYGLETANDRSWRWSQRSGRVIAWTTGPSSPARISFRTTAAAAGTLELWAADNLAWTATVRGGEFVTADVLVTIASGSTTLEWKFNGRLRRPGGSDRRLLGFLVQDLRVTYAAIPESPAR
jgi:hypothetical protein